VLFHFNKSYPQTALKVSSEHSTAHSPEEADYEHEKTLEVALGLGSAETSGAS